MPGAGTPFPLGSPLSLCRLQRGSPCGAGRFIPFTMASSMSPGPSSGKLLGMPGSHWNVPGGAGAAGAGAAVPDGGEGSLLLAVPRHRGAGGVSPLEQLQAPAAFLSQRLEPAGMWGRMSRGSGAAPAPAPAALT